MPSASGWHREDIKAALRKRYGHITHLSRAWGYSRAAISNTLISARQSMAVERRISEALEVPLHVLWPDRWAPDGEPRVRPGATRTNRQRNVIQHQNGEAA